MILILFNLRATNVIIWRFLAGASTYIFGRSDNVVALVQSVLLSSRVIGES